jgi:ribosomal protein S9
VDGIPYEERFTRIDHRQIITRPFTATDTSGKYDQQVATAGITGQASSIAQV